MKFIIKIWCAIWMAQIKGKIQMEGEDWKGKKIKISMDVVSVRVWLLKTERGRNGLGKTAQPEEEDRSFGRERRESWRMEWRERGDWPIREEERRKGERRRHGGSAGSPIRPVHDPCPFSSKFLHFSGELLQTISWKTFYDLPSTHSIPNLERFGVEIRKNAQKGAVALCVRFSHFWNVFFQLLIALAFP